MAQEVNAGPAGYWQVYLQTIKINLKVWGISLHHCCLEKYQFWIWNTQFSSQFARWTFTWSMLHQKSTCNYHWIYQ